jgi:hypothetical protein
VWTTGSHSPDLCPHLLSSSWLPQHHLLGGFYPQPPVTTIPPVLRWQTFTWESVHWMLKGYWSVESCWWNLEDSGSITGRFPCKWIILILLCSYSESYYLIDYQMFFICFLRSTIFCLHSKTTNSWFRFPLLISLVWSIKLLWSIDLYSWFETQCYCFNTTFGLHPTGWSILADFWVFLKMFEASPTCWIESHQITFTWTPPVSTNFLLLFFGSTTKRPPPRPKPSDGAGLARHPQRCQTRRPGKGFEWIFHIWTVTPGIYIYIYYIHYILYNVY